MLWAGTEDSLGLYISQSDWLATPQAQEAHKEFLASMDVNESAEERSSPILTVANGVGIVNISGVLVGSDHWINSYMGWLSQAEIQRALMEASSNPDVTSLLLDVTSPGGQVTMTLETARLIKAVDKIKPVYGFAETAASGAYWLISAARKRYISATGIAGSIGVVTQHIEYSEYDKKEGIKRKILRTGEYKQLFNSVEPLTPAAETETLKLMFEMEAVFVREVSSNLKLSIAQLEPALEGREFAGQQAVDVGLFDKVDTFQNVLSTITQKEGEGGTQTMKKGKTYQMASAFAGGGETEAAALLKAADEAAALLKADADLKAADEAAALLKAATDRTAAGEGTEEDAALIKASGSDEDVVDPNIALLAEKDKEILALSELAGKLSAVVAKAVGNMCIALNTENPLKEGAEPNEVLSVYNEKAELFVALYPTGGVASVGEDEEKPKVAAPSRFEAAQRKQVVVPKNG
jgi:signal peptide peptidase SppA